MPLEGLGADIAQNPAFVGIENMDALGRAYLDADSRANPENWRSRLPAELQENESLKKFKSDVDVFGSYVNLEKMVGNKRALPGENATDADWDALYKDLGRPDTPEAYTLAPPADFPQELYSKELESGYRALAHKFGLSQKQVAGLYDGFIGLQMDMIGQMVQNEAAAKAENEKGLRAEWGDKYEANLALANDVIQKMGANDPLIAQSLEAKDPVWNHPALARFLYRISEAMRESTLIKGGPDQTPSLQAEAIGLMRSEAWMNKMHPDHKETVAKVQAIAGRMKFPEQKE